MSVQSKKLDTNAKVIGNNITANIIKTVGATRIYPKRLSASSKFLCTFYYL